VSIEDRSVGPREQVLTYRSHAGDMGPVSLVVSCPQELTFPHCSLAVVREKLGTDPRI
jgi:hypothetical protein